MERDKHIPSFIFSYLIFASVLFTFNFCTEPDFRIEEITLDQIHTAFAENRLSSRELVDFYMRRIETLNPELCTVIGVNPKARDQADEADQQWKYRIQDSKVLGSLHGIPVLVLDSIPNDASVVGKLRKAGGLILGKVRPLENSLSDSVQAQNEWCTKNDQTMNPYVASGDPCGSSSSSAISITANMAAVSLATEVDGSIVCSADRNSVVGMKPTVGLTSRAGIQSLPTRLGTVGPIGRTVSDAVSVLDVIVGYDPEDPEATGEAVRFIPEGGYKQFLNKDRMNGKRIAIIKTAYLESFPIDSITASMFEKHMETLRLRGATIIDDLAAVYIDLILNPYKSSEAREAVIRFNVIWDKYLTPEHNSIADMTEGDRLAASYLKAGEVNEEMIKVFDIAKNVSCTAFEKLMENYDLDAVVTLGKDAYELLGVTGYPGITVPAGYEANGMPFGICFSGLRGSEPTLIQLAYGFEQASNIRRPPNFSKIYKTEDYLYLSGRKSHNSSFGAVFPGDLTGHF